MTTSLLTNRPVITGAGHALPPPMKQADLWDGFFRDHYADERIARKVWQSSGIDTRRGVVDPTQEDISGWGTGRRMQRFLAEALPLGKEAIAGALATAGLDPADVGLLTVVSCTGYVTPGLDILLARDLGMTDDVQRLHIGHMGCYAALPGLGAASDFVAARQRPAVLLCLELTSLHVQPTTDTARAGTPTPEDLQQMVAHALFSDAAAAVVLTPGSDTRGSDTTNSGTTNSGTTNSGTTNSGTTNSGTTNSGTTNSGTTEPGTATAPAYEVIDTIARTDVSTADHMTWDVTDLGFKMGLSPAVPDVLARHARPVVTALLERHGLAVEEVGGWAVHPGGRKIVRVVGEQLGLSDEQLEPSYATLREVGNCSSATVLLVLERVTAQLGAYVVAMAFGPGLTLCATLLRRVR